MDFTDTGINRSDTLTSDKDHDLRQWYYSSLDPDLHRLRNQIFEAVYRKTDLIRANHELCQERDALRRRNRELEAGFSDAVMSREATKRDLEVCRERVSELEENTMEKSKFLSEIADSVRSVEDRLSKSILYSNDENVPEGRRGKLESEEYDLKSILELTKEAETKVEKLMESMEKKKMELSRSLELLEEENRDISVLLRAALSDKQPAEKPLKETNEQKRSVLRQIAERGLQRIGFGFKEPVQESSETGNFGKNEEENGVVIAVEKTMKNLRKECSQLKISLEESRLEQARLKKITEEQAQKIAENTMYTDKLQNHERFLSQNVEELVKVIREAELEVSRWREACELEVEAGQREVEERDLIIAILKAEAEKMRSELEISERKLKLKEELSKAAMAAEEAAEKSLRLAERRIAELLSRIEHLYNQLEEAESTERKHRKLRYNWCWPLWRLPTAATAAVTASAESNRVLLRYECVD